MWFVKEQNEIGDLAPRIVKKQKGDASLLFCYPNETSKKYSCDFNRDTGWATLGKLA